MPVGSTRCVATIIPQRQVKSERFSHPADSKAASHAMEPTSIPSVGPVVRGTSQSIDTREPSENSKPRLPLSGTMAKSVRIRRGRIGDLGWAFGRQAILYHEEFRYSQVFETYVARGLAPFLDHFDAKRDALWVAELAGTPVGAIAIQHDPDRPGLAKLRWYFVEKAGRGCGIGSRLLSTALRFARKARYRGVLLWTVDDLHAARRQYERAGFVLAHTDPKPCSWAPWGHEQRWELRLPRAPTGPVGPRRPRR